MELIDYIDNYEGRDEVAPKAMCDHCTDHFNQNDLRMVDDGTPLPLFLCGDCHESYVEAQEEQECSCVRIDVDYYDARGCAAHGERRAA